MTINLDISFLLWLRMLYNAQMMARKFRITISTFLAATFNGFYSTFLCYYASLFLALSTLEEDD